LGNEPAQRHAVLPTIASIPVLKAWDEQVACIVRVVVAAEDQIAIIAAIGHHIGTREESAAVVDDRLVPFELIESLHGQVGGQVLAEIEHIDRYQAFLDLRTGAAEGGHIDRVDLVYTADEEVLAPADHLFAEARRAGQLVDFVAGIDEGVENLRTRGLSAADTTAVVNIVEPLVTILQLEVVPVLATQE